MSRRIAFFVVATVAACSAQTAPSTTPTPLNETDTIGGMRAIRRTIPMTNTIRRGLATGTRDSTGRPGRNYWQLWMDYTINARLDAPTSTISGRETIVLRNGSDSVLRNIALRLDQNYFAPNAARIEPNPAAIEITTGMKVSRLVVNGQAVDLAQRRGGAASPGSSGGPIAIGLDQTVAVVGLQNPIAAKGSATLEIDWSFKVPGVEGVRGQRMGRYGDTLYQVAQWYPRVAVYDDVRGWDYEPYLGNAEFYNNFGRWDVSIDVPAGWLVGATGVLRNPDAVLSQQTRERLSRVLSTNDVVTIVGRDEMGVGRATAAGDRLVWRFTADTANDFAWATSKSFVWKGTHATIPGRSDVPVNVLYLPGDSANFAPVPMLTKHALEFYSRLWMPYSFPQLTVVDGPELGMEYPMFIMSAAGAADHETGHEWWPMTVSNNETWYGWMDEGFNQYMNILSEADLAKRPAILDGVAQAYGQVSGNELESPMMWPANYQAGLYGFTTYGKAPQMLAMLGAMVGDSAVQRAMSQWAQAWRFKHPTPWDYMFFMSNALGRDLGWFWYYWLFTTDAVNERIAGVVTDPGGRVTVAVQQNGEMPSPVVLKVEFAPTGAAIGHMPNARMVDSTTAIVSWPVNVWFGGSRTFAAPLDFGSRPIQRITLDPFRRFPDRDARDNVWPR